MKKIRKRLSVMRLEERVLFDAAAVAAAAEAAQQEQENQDLQQQQQELQEQMAEEAAQQQAQQAAGVDSQTPAADTDTDADTEAPAADDAAAAQGGEAAQADSAGSEVADAVESITADDGVEGAELADLPGSEAGADVVGDTLEGLNQDQTDVQQPAAADTAAVDGTDTDADSDTDAADAAAAFAPDAEETPEAPEHHELAIISGTVPDSKLIIDSLAEGTEVLVLNSDSDALDQINEYLDASAVKYDAIHIVSHGGDGYMVLSGQLIDMESLDADPASWAAIGEHLTDDGDILLYGCNIAAGENGKAFASQLASLTGADVAASVTPMGQYGWELEYMTGSIAAPVITVAGYDYSLAPIEWKGDVSGSFGADNEAAQVVLTGNVFFVGDVSVVGTSIEFSAGSHYGIYSNGNDFSLTVKGDTGSLTFDNVSATIDAADVSFAGNPAITVKDDANVNIDVHSQSQLTKYNSGITVDGGHYRFGLTGSEVVKGGGTWGVAGANLFVTLDKDVDHLDKTVTLLGQQVTISGAHNLNGYDFEGTYGGHLDLSNVTGALNVQDGASLTIFVDHLPQKTGTGYVVVDDASRVVAYFNTQASLDAFQTNPTVSYTGDFDLGLTLTISSAADLSGKTVGQAGIDVGLILAADVEYLTGNATVLGDNVTITGAHVLNGYNFGVALAGNLDFTGVTGSLTVQGGADVWVKAQNLPGALTVSGSGSNVVAFVTSQADLVKYSNNSTVAVTTASDGSYFIGLESADVFEGTTAKWGASDVNIYMFSLDNAALGSDKTITGADIIIHANGYSIDAGEHSLNFVINKSSGTGGLLVDNVNGELSVASLTVKNSDGAYLAVSGGDMTISKLTLSDGKTILTGHISVTALSATASTKAWAVGAGTDIFLTIADGSKLSDKTGAEYRVREGGELHISLNNAAMNGGIRVDDGKLYLDGSVSTVQGMVVGTDAASEINISGDSLTLMSAVGLGEDGGTLNVSGRGEKGIAFLDDFTNALGWTTVNGYQKLKTDTSDYTYSAKNSFGADAADLRAGKYNGTINLEGKVTFNDEVISTGKFNINASTTSTATSIAFSAGSYKYVAVAGGKFTIADGTDVSFGSDVYISGAYNGRDTTFTVDGGTVRFSGNVLNWVRSWRGNDAYKVSDNFVPGNSDLVDDTYTSGTTVTHFLVLRTDRTVTTTVNFNGGNITFATANTGYYNNGTFGIAKTNVSAEASVSFQNIQSFAYDAIDKGTSAGVKANYKAAGSGYKWASDYTARLSGTPFETSTVEASGYKDDIATNGAVFYIEGNAIINGKVLNAGTNAHYEGWAGTTPVTPGAGMYIFGTNNRFYGTVANEDSASLFVSGSGNTFSAIQNNLEAKQNGTYTVLRGTNDFGNVTNRGTMDIINVADAQMSFTNTGGNATFTGDGEGLKLGAFRISGGSVLVASEFGSPGIRTDITVGSGAALNIDANNTITGNITNNGEVQIQDSVTDFTIIGDITNNNIFSIAGMTDIQGKVTNTGSFTASASGIVFGEAFSNTGTGTLNIARAAVFYDLVNEAGGKVGFTPRSGGSPGAENSVFYDLVNKGDFNVSVESVIFVNSLTNDGTMKLSAAGARFKDMVDPEDGTIRFVNNSSLNITAKTAAGQFVAIDNRGTLTASADVTFGRTVNTGTITVESPAKLVFRGTLENEGEIGGSGTAYFEYAVSGAGTVNFGKSGAAFYNYNNAVEVDPASGADSAVTVDSDGYCRLGGELLYFINSNGKPQTLDNYTNRPEFDSVKSVWKVGAVEIAQPEGFVPYVGTNGNWFVGDVDSGVAAAKQAAGYFTFSHSIPAPADGNHGVWQVSINGAAAQDLFLRTAASAEAVAVDIGQSLFGGTVGTLTVKGNAVVDSKGDGNYTYGVLLGEGLSLDVTSAFYSGETGVADDGVRTELDRNSELTLSGSKYTDDAASSFVLRIGSTLNIRLSAAPGSVPETVLNGSLANNGAVDLAADNLLTVKGETEGSGTVTAEDGSTVFYDEAAAKVFSGVYDGLELQGDKTLEGNASVNTLTFKTPLVDADLISELTVSEGAFTLNKGISDASAAGIFTFGDAASGLFKADGMNYTISRVNVTNSAIGVTFQGDQGSVITVTELDNRGLAEHSSEYTGVTVNGYTAFGTVENHGLVTVKGGNVTLGAFNNRASGADADSKILMAGELVLDPGAGEALDYTDGVQETGGLIDVLSGSLTVSGGAFDGSIRVADGAALELAYAAAYRTVTVDSGASLTWSAAGGSIGVEVGGTIGTDGLILNGALDVTGSFTLYQYAGSSDAAITIQNGAALTLFGTIADYGEVAASIDSMGTLTDANHRATGAVVEWLVVTVNSKTSDYAGTGAYKFYVTNDATLTVDDLNDDYAFKLDTASQLVFEALEHTVNGVLILDDTAAVTVNANAAVTFGGTITVGSTAADVFTVGAGASVVFGGEISGEGSVNAADSSNVTYAVDAAGFKGTYGTLTVNGEVSVGDVTIATALTGTGAVSFAGTVAGNAVVTGTGLSVAYNASGDGQKVFGTGDNAAYAALTFKGAHTVDSNVAVGGKTTITGSDAAVSVAKNVSFTMNGSVEGVKSGRIEGATGSTVSYGLSADAQIFSGKYYDLQLNGSSVTYTIDSLELKHELSGDSTVNINGLQNAGADQRITGTLTAVYGADAHDVLGGNYSSLYVNASDAKVWSDVTVADTLFNKAVLTGNADVTLNGRVSGEGAFGSADEAYGGTVTYGSTAAGETQTVLGGNYAGVVLSGNAKNIARSVAADTFTIAAGTGKVAVTGSIDAGLLTNNAAITNKGTLSFGANSVVGTVSNSGKVRVTGGDFAADAFAGLANASGASFSVGSGASVTLVSANVAENNTFTADAGGRLTFSGDIENVISSLTDNGVVTFANGAATVDALAGTGDLTLDTATLNVSGANGTVGGTTTVGAGSTLNVWGSLTLADLVIQDSGSIFAGDNDHTGAYLGLNVVNDGLVNEGYSMAAGVSSTLEFISQATEQWIWGDVSYEMNGKLVYDPNFTHFVHEPEEPWFVVDTEMTIDGTGEVHSKYRVVDGGVLTVLNADAATRFKVNGGELIFANTDALSFDTGVTTDAGLVTVSGAGGVTFTGIVTNAGTFTVAAGAGTPSFQGGFTNNGEFRAGGAYDGLVTNNSIFTVTASGLTLPAANLDNAAGTVAVAAGVQTTIDGVGTGALNVAKGAQVTLANVAAADFMSVVTAGTIAATGDVTFSGTVEAQDSAVFVGTGNMTFSGNTSGKAVFNGNVVYTGAIPASVMGGTYAGDLTFDGTGTKIFDGAVVTVAGTLTNNSGAALVNISTVSIKGAAGNGIYTIEAGSSLIVNGSDADVSVDNAGNVTVIGDNASVNVSDNSGTITVSGEDAGVLAVNNTGTVTLSGNSVTVDVTGTNSGTITASGEDAGVVAANNTGLIDVTGNNAAIEAGNSGTIAVSGNNAELGGNNKGFVSVEGSATTTMTDEAGASYDIGSGSVLTLGGNGGTYNADFNNAGTVRVDAPSVFNGSVTGSEDSRIIVTENAAGTYAASFFSSANKGALELYGWSDLTNKNIANNVQVYYGLADADLAGTTITAKGFLGINADSTLNTAPVNNGTVHVGKDATLTYTDAVGEVGGTYDVDGELSGEGALVFTGAVNINDGGLISAADGTTFTGKTSGSGSVSGDVTYSGAAVNVFGGAYTGLTVNTHATLMEGVQAEVEDMTLNGTLGTGDGSTLILNGATLGNGAMTGGDGEVVYNGSAAEQSIYAGTYNDLTLGENAVGDFDVRGDISIRGDAVNLSYDAGLAVTDATVTYDGSSPQQVMAGSYDALVLNGTGSKRMEADFFSVNSFTAAGASGRLLTVASAESPSRWTLDAGDISIHYVNLRDADSTRKIYLDGTNMTGGSISDNWLVFNSAGGVGDAFPGPENRNFAALAFYSDRLSIAPTEDLFSFAHRLPGGARPIAVGESLRPQPLIGAYDSYDLINFDSGDGIRLLDEESREVLSDASAAGSSDLVELLEEK